MEKIDLEKTGESISRIKRIHTTEGVLDRIEKEAESKMIHEKSLEQGIGTPSIIQKLKENIEIFEIMLKEAEKEKDLKRYNFLISRIGQMKNKMLEIIQSN